MRIFITEDEILVAEHLAQIVEAFGYTVAGSAHNKHDAIQGINQKKPDIALLDIKLQGKYDGIEVAETVLQNRHFPIIYITAQSERLTMDKALKTKPSAYIVKPFAEADVYTAIQIAIENFRKQQTENYIMVKDGYQTVKIPFDDVFFIKTDNNYVEIHTKNTKFLLRKSLQEVCSSLDSNSFIKTHRSFVINKNKITRLASKYVFLDKMKIPVSRKYIPDVKKLFKT